MRWEIPRRGGIGLAEARIITGRLWLAFALLPVANLVFGYALFPIFRWLADHGSARPVDPAGEALAIGILCGVLALLVTICGGIPVLFWLRRRGPITLQQTLAAGVLLGNTSRVCDLRVRLTVFALMHLLAGTLSEHLAPAAELVLATVRVVLLGSVLGLASALVVWILGIRNTALVR